MSFITHQPLASGAFECMGINNIHGAMEIRQKPLFDGSFGEKRLSLPHIQLPGSTFFILYDGLPVMFSISSSQAEDFLQAIRYPLLPIHVKIGQKSNGTLYCIQTLYTFTSQYSEYELKKSNTRRKLFGEK